ncbi:MAG: LutC/YkgG family protein [Desulforhopalus sp.]
MTDNQYVFMKTIRTAVGKPAESIRPKNQFPRLFASPDTTSTLAAIDSRTELERQELIDVLCDNAKAINLHTHIAGTYSELRDLVVELIRTREPEFNHTKHVIVHDSPDLAGLDLWKRFTREAVTVHTTFPGDHQVREKTLASFVGITAPFLGIADSATIVELTGPGRPRSTSLVPSIHIAILRRQQVVANLKEARALLTRKKIDDSFVFITGPSKTADIEAHMVHGAHGPREMHLILLSEQSVKEQQEKAEKVHGTALNRES